MMNITPVIVLGVIAAVSTTAFSAQPDATLRVEAIGGGTITSSPEGINCPGECTAQFPESTSVTLTTAANEEQKFLEWGGACVGSEPSCTIEMRGDMNVSGAFSEQWSTY